MKMSMLCSCHQQRNDMHGNKLQLIEKICKVGGRFDYTLRALATPLPTSIKMEGNDNSLVEHTVQKKVLDTCEPHTRHLLTQRRSLQVLRSIATTLRELDLFHPCIRNARPEHHIRSRSWNHNGTGCGRNQFLCE